MQTTPREPAFVLNEDDKTATTASGGQIPPGRSEFGRQSRGTHMSTDISVIQGDIFACQEAFNARRADRDMNFEAEAGFAMQIISGKDYTLRVAMQNRQAVVDAITNISAIGLSLNPALKHAYLVPRDGKIVLDISYMGLLHIAVSSGSIAWGQAEIVREGDEFEIHGFDQPPTHSRKPFAIDRGGVVGAYCVVKTRQGDFLTTPMALAELYNIRDRSEAWKRGGVGKRGPWESFEEEMMKKTVIKRAYKLWPKSDQNRLENAIHHLNTGGEGIDFDAEQRPSKAPGVAADPALLEAARDAAKQGRSYFAGWYKDESKGGQTTRAQRETLKPYLAEFESLCAAAAAVKPPAEDVIDAEVRVVADSDDWSASYERVETAGVRP